MTVNIADIIIGAVLVLCLVGGMYKGFITSALTAAGFVGAWFGAYTLYPMLVTEILKNHSLVEMVSYYLDVGSMFSPRSLGETMVSGVVGDGSQLNAAIQGLAGLPEVIKNAFRNNVTSQLFADLENFTGNFTNYLDQTIIHATVNVLSFLVIFVVLYLILSLIVNLLNGVFRFPLLKHLDWLLGGLFGLARGYLIMMLVLAVVPMALSMLNLEVVSEVISGSALIRFFPTQRSFPIDDIINAAFRSFSG